jgi:DedD protein
MDQKLKQRLIGAIVLISLAVIFIPIILEGPDDEWSPRVQEIPVPPQLDYPAEVELPVPAEPARETPAAEEPAAPPVTPETSPLRPEPEPAASKPPAPAAKPAAAPSGSWVIQVGSFSQKLNASGLRDRLKKAGYASYLQETSSGNVMAWRVLVGPYETRAAAEKQRDRITREHHLKGMVTQARE